MKDAVAKDTSGKIDAANYAASERLRDGRSMIIRAIRPEDKGLLVDALGKLSPESIYFRLFSARKGFTEDELKQAMSRIDFRNIVQLVAVLEKDGGEEIVGGGRYVRLDPSETGQSAEVAFLIDDAHQGFGIGTRLFKHLLAIARGAGISQFEAEVLPSNKRMLKVFTRSGLTVEQSATRDSVHLKMKL
jgi:RimJ/RimL family protein N-acetyltransferase